MCLMKHEKALDGLAKAGNIDWFAMCYLHSLTYEHTKLVLTYCELVSPTLYNYLRKMILHVAVVQTLIKIHNSFLAHLCIYYLTGTF